MKKYPSEGNFISFCGNNRILPTTMPGGGIKRSALDMDREKTPDVASQFEKLLGEVEKDAGASDFVKKAFILMFGQLQLMQQQMEELIRKSDKNPSVELFSTEEFDTAVAEAVEEKERKRALVFSNVPESQATSSTARCRDDYGKVETVLESLGVEALPVAVYRMGAPSARYPRLLKVILSHSRAQKIALSRAPSLKNSPFNGVFIRPSLTAAQREADKELRDELSRRREAGERGLMIYRGSIIERDKRPPYGATQPYNTNNPNQ